MGTSKTSKANEFIELDSGRGDFQVTNLRVESFMGTRPFGLLVGKMEFPGRDLGTFGLPWGLSIATRPGKLRIRKEDPGKRQVQLTEDLARNKEGLIRRYENSYSGAHFGGTFHKGYPPQSFWVIGKLLVKLPEPREAS